MSDSQFVGIMVGFAVAVTASMGTTLMALLINNARLTDTKEALRAEIGLTRSELQAEMGSVRAEMKAMEARLDSKFATVLSQMATYQMDIISKIAELDNRITRLER